MLAVAYEDTGSNSNPKQKPVDWSKTLSNLPVESPSTYLAKIPALGSLTVIDGSRSTSIDGTTVFSIEVSSIDANRYRVTRTGGTAPAFRTARTADCSAIALTLTVNANLSVTVQAGSGTSFSAAVVGDVVFIPGASTGDSASPFNTVNEGYWTVLSRTNTSLQLARAAGTVFSGIGEVVTPSTAAQLQVFSADGIQVGDTVELAAGFASTSLHSYGVLAVNPSWFEFESTAPLGEETGIMPTASGIVFYTASKRWLRVEVDQECVARFNGDTGNTNRIEPVIAGDKNYTGWCEKFGSVWKLVIVNRSTSQLSLVVLSAE